jgi:hypothetical protein
MVQWWDQLAFVHWCYEPAEVQRLLPEGLFVDEHDGSAWVSLVPFFLRVGLPGTPSVPWFSRFAETNVRTYVRSADGRRGVWFSSLDAERLGAVVVARVSYQLPYFWAEMSIDGPPGGTADPTGVWTYRSRRRWPGPRGATSELRVRVGDVYRPDELGSLDHFLTARWGLFSSPPWGLRHAPAWHEPWPLRRAEVLDLDDGLLAAAGLPPPPEPPLAHWSPGVEVRIGWPVHVRR